MVKIRYSILTLGREARLKVLSYVTAEWFVFLRVTSKAFQRWEELAN